METPSEYTIFSPQDIPVDAHPHTNYEDTWEKNVAKQIIKSVKARRNKEENPQGNNGHDQPYMVSLTGIPGSGKTVSCLILAHDLEEEGIGCMVMPHDGYHYPLDFLKTYPDSDERIYRRGAPDTFNPRALLRDLKRMKGGDEEVITVPAFDHANGDPEPDKHVFDRTQHSVVICEGLYLLHDDHGWKEIGDLFDLSIFMDSNLERCMERLKIRNQCIPGYSPEEIAERVEAVDRKNAITVNKSKARAHMSVNGVAAGAK